MCGGVNVGVWKPEDSFSQVGSHFLPLWKQSLPCFCCTVYTKLFYELVNYFVSNSHLNTLVLRLQVHTTALAFFFYLGMKIRSSDFFSKCFHRLSHLPSTERESVSEADLRRHPSIAPLLLR